MDSLPTCHDVLLWGGGRGRWCRGGWLASAALPLRCAGSPSRRRDPPSARQVCLAEADG